ncbi:MAG: heme-binding protein [Blastocatellia bacterium]|nr:heme-binding protein [Blastocatellia bacterium]
MRPLSRLFNRMTIAALAAILLLTFIIGSTRIGRNSAEAQTPSVYCVNGASFIAPIAPGSFAVLGGANLATTTIATSVANTTQLGGTTLTLTDASGATFTAPLIYVSPTQINFMIPNQVALGTLNFTVTNGNGVAQSGSVQVIKTAPALFTFSQSGQGVPLGGTTYDGVTYKPLANPDNSPAPVDPGYPTKPNVLALFGTGFRFATNVSVRIGNTDYPAVYSGVDGSGRPGFDQVNVQLQGNIPNGLTNISIIADGQVSQSTQVTFSVPVGGGPALLSLNDVQTIINQCVQRAKQINLPGTCAVVDREGNTLAVFQMTGANPMTRITANKPPGGLEGLMVPASAAAISKAGTSAFFSTQGSAISTRTASFIIQENFPPGVANMEGGPLFGVQFSQLPCSDVRPPGQTLPLGLSGDPGSYSLYRNNIALGGVGFEGDGIYSLSGIDPTIQPPEEIIATAAGFGFDTPQALRIDNVRVNGITLPYSNVPQTGSAAPQVTAADGTYLLPPRAAPPSRFIQTVVGGIPAKIDPRFFPPKASAVPGGLTTNDVLTILSQALQIASRERAAIRVGGNQAVQINASVVDTTGTLLGLASTTDAPEFGFDVCVQKGRTANLFSSANVVQLLNAFDNGTNTVTPFVNAALALGVPLNGTIAYSTRGIGFLDRPFFPDGQNSAPNGPFSVPIVNFSPFNDGIQLALITPDLVNVLNGTPSTPCVAGVPGIGNGIQPFAGAVSLYKNGMRVGAVGISGDGIDQDDTTASGGSIGFEAPSNINSSNVIINTPNGPVRLPYVRFPANPFLN